MNEWQRSVKICLPTDRASRFRERKKERRERKIEGEQESKNERNGSTTKIQLSYRLWTMYMKINNISCDAYHRISMCNTCMKVLVYLVPPNSHKPCNFLFNDTHLFYTWFFYIRFRAAHAASERAFLWSIFLLTNFHRKKRQGNGTISMMQSNQKIE